MNPGKGVAPSLNLGEVATETGAFGYTLTTLASFTFSLVATVPVRKGIKWPEVNYWMSLLVLHKALISLRKEWI